MTRLHAFSTLAALTAFVGCTSTDTSGTEHNASTGSISTTTTGGASGGATGGTSGGAGATTGTDPWSLDGGVTVTVSTLAGNGNLGYRDGTGGHDGTAEFEGPNGVAVDSAGNVYVADTNGHRIRKVDPQGNVTTLAGNGASTFQDGTGGPNGTAQFDLPSGVALDEANGFLLVSDDGINRIRKVMLSDGATTTFAGKGTAGFVDGASGTAEFRFLSYNQLGFSGMCGDGQGNFFVADVTNNAIRTLGSDGSVGTLAGTGQAGFKDGAGGRNGVAKFTAPGACAADGQGNLYVADFGNNRVRKIDSQGNVTTVAGNGVEAHHDGSGGPQGTAELVNPAGIAYDPGSGTLFVPDTFSDYIRHIAADGTVITIAGSLTGWHDGPGSQARFDAPAGMAVDSQGRLIVVDFFGYDVRILSFQ